MNAHRRACALALLTCLGLTILLSGCNLPSAGNATSIPQVVLATYVAETVQAQATLASNTPELPVPSTPTDTPVLTVLPTETQTVLAENTPTPTDSPATATVTATLTSSVPLINAEQDTRCRLGPSTVYAVVGFLLTTEQSTVHGKDSGGEWWYIENPKKPGANCWVWGGSTQVSGDTGSLPVITPPPTPTFTATVGPAFVLTYDNVHACGSTPTAIIKVQNNGNEALESLNLKIEDLTNSTTLYAAATSNAPFMGSSGECPPGGDALPAGQTYFIGGAIGAGNGGHTARATVKLCTEEDLDGACETRTVQFTIP
jgi:hypothetical protein